MKGSGTYHIYNGPDMHCEKMSNITRERGDTLVVTKSFQAMIEAHMSFDEFTVFVNSKRGPDIMLSMKYSDDYKVIKMPFNSCNENNVTFCITHVTSVLPIGINVTILSLNYTGPSTIGHLCLYGGIVIYNTDDRDTLSEHLLECENIDAYDFQSFERTTTPSVFSEAGSSDMWISFYSYQPYSHATGILHISATHCKTLPLSPEQHKCNIRFEYHLFMWFNSLTLELSKDKDKNESIWYDIIYCG